MKCVLAIDIGTTAVKVVLLTEDHRMAAEASESYDLISLHPGWAEENAQIWWEKTVLAVGRLKTMAPAAFAAVSVIGVSGMVPAIVLLDENGQPLRNTIQQNDARCVEEIDQLKKTLDQEQLFALTGGFTNQQHILPRLLWVKDHEPAVWQKISHIMGSYDYINYKLTGNFSLELNWAVESGAWDITENHWIPAMLESCGVDPSWLPPVFTCSQFMGKVSREAALMLDPSGCLEGVPVTGGSADHVASALASGVIRPGDLLIKFGGAGDILFCTAGTATDSRLFYDAHDIPGCSLINGCMAASGSLVKWYLNEVLGNGGRAVLSTTGDNPEPEDNLNPENNPEPDMKKALKKLDEEAASIRPGSEGLVVLPYFLGEKTPIFDPQAKGVIFGLGLSHTYAHIYRAVLESVIYGFRHHADILNEKGLHHTRVFASDGGAKSPLWCQIAADVLGCRVTAFPAHPGSSLGVGFAAGLAAGIYHKVDEVVDFLPDRKTYEPNPANKAVYDKCYQVYRSLYEKTQDQMHLLSNLY